MSPEEILLSLGSKGTKENIAEIESYQNREVSIQSMLDGGGVKVVLAGGGFEFIEPYKYKVDKSNKKLRNKVYEFLRKKFNINDKLQIILASNKSKLSPLEKEFQKELIEELENSLNEYKKGGVKEIEIQKEIQLKIAQSNNSIKLPKIIAGLGIAVISTSQGVMTDRKARALGQGGEVLCAVS